MNPKTIFAQHGMTTTLGLAVLLLASVGGVGCASAAAPPSSDQAATEPAEINDLDTVPASAKTTQALGIKTWGVNPTQDGSPGAVVHAYDAKNTLLAEIVQTTSDVGKSSHQFDISIMTSDGTSAMSVLITDAAADADDPSVPSDAKVLKDNLSTDADAMNLLTSMDSDVGAHNPSIRKDGAFASEVSLGASDSSDTTDSSASDLSGQSLRFDYWGQSLVDGTVSGVKSLVHKVDCNIVQPVKCGDGIYKVVRDGIQLVKGCGGAAAKDVGEEEAAGAVCSAVTGAETAGVGVVGCEGGAQIVAAGTFLYQCGKAVYNTYKDSSGAKDSCENSAGENKCSK